MIRFQEDTQRTKTMTNLIYRSTNVAIGILAQIALIGMHVGA